MKGLIHNRVFLAAVAGLFCINVFAETTTEPVSFAVGIGVGISPETAMDNFNTASWDSSHPMASIYGDHSGNVYSCGEIAVQGEMKIKKWFALTLDAGLTPVWSDVSSGATGKVTGTRRGLCLSVYPSAKFYYMNRKNIRLYGDIGLGFCRYFNFSRRGAAASFQMNPIGIELGNRLFGFLKFGFGTAYMGLQGGIGYKFGN